MKNKIIITTAIKYVFLLVLLLQLGCRRDLSVLPKATYSNNGAVFMGTFSKNLVYAAFGGTVLNAFQVDSSVTYNHATASMRFEVPDKNDPRGAYAGGSFFVTDGRDLSGYDALTFWAKSSAPETIGVLGFGNDFGANQYQVALNNVALNTNWKKIIIPIPNASKLTGEKGLFYYSAGADNNGKGYTFWVQNVQFEKLGTISNPTPSMLGGTSKQQISFVGVTNTLTGFSESFNLPTGVSDTLAITPAYFDFATSNASAATVSSTGVITTVGSGNSVISATVGGVKVKGNITINSQGNFTPAPTPTKAAANVISVFSDAYNNVPVDYFNGYWAPYQTTQSADFVVNGNHVLNYTNFNFVGIQASKPTFDASSMAALHVDLYFPAAIAGGTTFKIQVLDFGGNGAPGGGDDVTDTYTVPAGSIKSASWVGVDIPFSSLPGLTTKQHIGQIIFVGTNVTNFFADNIYFYGYAATPTSASPTPTVAKSNVFSIFSDTYGNLAGTNFNPNWGQATVVSTVSVGGVNTLKYAGLNYQGTDLGSNSGTPQDVSGYGFMHLDYYTTSSSSLNVTLINSGAVTGGGPVQTSKTLAVPTNGVWTSIDIPLSAFAPVNLAKIDQMSFAGNGTIYLQNIYFWKIPTVPPVAPPTPTLAANKVLSIFSAAYTSPAGIDLFPNWGQATVVSQASIGGVNTLLYTGLNYEGTQLASPVNVSSYTSLHIDYYSGNSNALNVFLINSGAVTGGGATQVSTALTVPTNGVWTSIDIPLSTFSPVDLAKVDQMMFTGNGNIYFGNIYFH